MVAGIFPPFFMDCPSLKYYFPSSLPLRLRIYITKTSIQKISLEATSYGGLECLFYAKADPCQKPVLKFVNEILSWLLAYINKEPRSTIPNMKLLSCEESSVVLKQLSGLKFGSFVTETAFLDMLNLRRFNFQAWLNSHPFTPFIPVHRVLPASVASSQKHRVLNLLRSFEEIS